jgi:polysaccharide export outer membrane protein
MQSPADFAFVSLQWFFSVVVLCGLLAACGGPTVDPKVLSATAPSLATGYRLGPEDKIKVVVFGEEDVSGEFLVDNTGVMSAPFVGQIPVAGMTLREFETTYAEKLRGAGLIKNPRVSAEVASFRPIYVLGEVHKPGQYKYVSGMTIQRAVALAEGYTYRANENRVEITRGGKKYSVAVAPNVEVMPADEIVIPERYF